MTTLDRSVSVISGTIERTLGRYRIRATVMKCEPRFRILRAILSDGRFEGIKHPGLSELLRYQWHRMRLHTSWSRA